MLLHARSFLDHASPIILRGIGVIAKTDYLKFKGLSGITHLFVLLSPIEIGLETDYICFRLQL